jgi:hypothetical protein
MELYAVSIGKYLPTFRNYPEDGNNSSTRNIGIYKSSRQNIAEDFYLMYLSLTL